MKNSLINIDKINKQIKLRDYSIAYNNLDSAEQTVSEIFGDLFYNFTSDKKSPFIIDAGSNIGIATLFFKQLYPNVKILCFEPDPNAFQMLKKNIANNNIENIDLINSALSKEEGEIDFFGQLSVESPDARGNSIIDAWGLQRSTSNSIKVKSVKLSSYLNCDVDFLKLDIEGAEQQVLENLERENKLSLIREMAIEVHQSDKIKFINNIDDIVMLLKRNNFSVKVTEKNTKDIMPMEIKNWVIQTSPQLFDIRAVRLDVVQN